MILFLLAFVAFLIIGIPISVSIGFSAVLGCPVSYTHLTLPTT